MNKKKNTTMAIRLFITVLAGAINAFGVGLLLVPNSFIDGGMSGISFLVSHFSGLPIGLFILLLNLPFFLIGIRKLGKRFILTSIIAIASYGVFMLLFGLIGGKIIETDHIILPAIFGGMLSGIGSGLTIKMGGSLDGVEVLAIMINRKIDISVGKIVMFFNVIIMVIAGFVFEWENALFSIIAYAVGIKAIDFVVTGLDKMKNIIIVTNKGDEVAKAISDKFGQGVTMLDSKGFYSKEHRSFIYFIVSRFELPILKNLVEEVDASAVISVTETSEVKGKNVRNRLNYMALKRNKVTTGVQLEDIEEMEMDSLIDINANLDGIDVDIEMTENSNAINQDSHDADAQENENRKE